jgi:hypothetical protein
MSREQQPYGDNFILVIPVERIIHTNQHPFCDNPTCYCHEDATNIAIVQQQVQDGLLTRAEATRMVQGKQLRRYHASID